MSIRDEIRDWLAANPGFHTTGAIAAGIERPRCSRVAQAIGSMLADKKLDRRKVDTSWRHALPATPGKRERTPELKRCRKEYERQRRLRNGCLPLAEYRAQQAARSAQRAQERAEARQKAKDDARAKREAEAARAAAEREARRAARAAAAKPRKQRAPGPVATITRLEHVRLSPPSPAPAPAPRMSSFEFEALGGRIQRLEPHAVSPKSQLKGHRLENQRTWEQREAVA